MYTECFDEELCRVILVANKYYIEPDAKNENGALLSVEETIFKAQLILTFQGHPVVIKPTDYFVKTPYQKTLQKIVKGGGAAP